jgi:hypothetical protein
LKLQLTVAGSGHVLAEREIDTEFLEWLLGSPDPLRLEHVVNKRTGTTATIRRASKFDQAVKAGKPKGTKRMARTFEKPPREPAGEPAVEHDTRGRVKYDGVRAWIQRQPNFEHSIERVCRMFPTLDREKTMGALHNIRNELKGEGSWNRDPSGTWTWTAPP